MRSNRTTLQRFFDKVEFTDTCWLWVGCKGRGYGLFTCGKLRPAHRILYEAFHGAIPSGLTLDHLCRVRACVRPDHLEPVTNEENIRRGLKGILKTHCIHGHAFTPENTLLTGTPKQRACRQCTRARGRAHDAKRGSGWVRQRQAQPKG